jgi:SAM-dependent methyltransferase
MTGSTAAGRWAEQLAAWAIPDRIQAQATQSPWIHPVELFRAGTPDPDTPSHRLAREVLPVGGSVLDVGCGGGRAAFALAPSAGSVTGVDHQPQMLAAFAAEAESRGLAHREVLGGWPAVADQVEPSDLVVCHHVAYNVADLAGFALALGRSARRRVVLELPQRHPLAGMAPFWRRFWQLERPDGPTAQDAATVLREAGLDVRLEFWLDDPGSRPVAALPLADQVRFLRIRLCLPADRDADVAAALAEQGPPEPRQLATLWWDV